MADPRFEVSDGEGGLKIESLRKSYRKRFGHQRCEHAFAPR